jgi:hypothetical protein
MLVEKGGLGLGHLHAGSWWREQEERDPQQLALGSSVVVEVIAQVLSEYLSMSVLGETTRQRMLHALTHYTHGVPSCGSDKKQGACWRLRRRPDTWRSPGV